jgi:hypothetical protein
MADTTPATLLAAAKCYDCFGGSAETLLDAMELVMLADIAANGVGSGMATDPQSLITKANCYLCYTRSQMRLMKLVLLSQIV